MQEITVYKTNDGKLFEDENKAKMHVINSICELIDNEFNSQLLKSGRFSASDVFQFINTVFGDYEKTENLIKKINKIIS